jgi:hypothetical protein
MNRHQSLAVYHARKYAETQLELERLRRRAVAPVHEVHVSPEAGLAIGVGVVGAVLFLGWLASRD